MAPLRPPTPDSAAPATAALGRPPLLAASGRVRVPRTCGRLPRPRSPSCAGPTLPMASCSSMQPAPAASLLLPAPRRPGLRLRPRTQLPAPAPVACAARRILPLMSPAPGRLLARLAGSRAPVGRVAAPCLHLPPHPAAPAGRLRLLSAARLRLLPTGAPAAGSMLHPRVHRPTVSVCSRAG